MFSPKPHGATWTNYSEQTIGDGPYEMTYDDTNGIMYSSSWFSGVWALKIGEGTGVIPDPPGPPPEGGSGNSSGGSSAAGSNGTGVGGGSGLGGSGVSSGGTTSAAGGSSATSSGGSGGASGPLGASSDRSTTDANAGCACRVGAPPSGANRGYWALVLLGLSVGLRTRLRRDSQS
jgi:MYXO-CTERM domain-containing protein